MARLPPIPSLRSVMLFGVKALLWFVVISVLWVTAYCFIPPPITFTMIGNAV
ncbi:MAG: hypothetical protein RL367_1724, partial [Pseudomonadota bacterium]